MDVQKEMRNILLRRCQIEFIAKAHLEIILFEKNSCKLQTVPAPNCCVIANAKQNFSVATQRRLANGRRAFRMCQNYVATGRRIVSVQIPQICFSHLISQRHYLNNKRN